MKTQKQLRREQLMKASKTVRHYYNTNQELVLNEHDVPTLFFCSIINTMGDIVMMKDCNSIPKSTKKQFAASFEEVVKTCCDDFIKDGDESSLIAGMLTFEVIVRNIREMSQGEEVE